ncbi:hemolysin activation protein [Escherichia coli]
MTAWTATSEKRYLHRILNRLISHTRYKLTSAELEAFNSVVDHWLAELTMNKLYDRVPASVWKYVI